MTIAVGWPSEERHGRLVELAPDGIVIHDGGVIVLANAAAVRLAGATSEDELVGRPIESLLDPPYLKAVQLHLVRDGDPVESTAPVRDILHRIDGVDLEVDVRAVAFVDRGRPSAHLVIRDITERLATDRMARQLEQQSEGRHQQIQRMEAVSALAAGVAHEVNNMMQVILGAADFLVLEANLTPEGQADVRKISWAAERAAAVSLELLAFGRGAAHRPVAADLAIIMYEAEPVVREILGAGRRLLLVAGAASRVRVDPRQLRQVIISLVQNARDAMPEDGDLTISTAEADVAEGTNAADGSAIPAGRYAILAVRDSGAGIAPDILPRIFEPFFTTKPVGRGTGLGLAAVLGLVAQNNGYITVVSAPGQGTTFTISLPLLPGVEVADRRRTSGGSVTGVAHAATVLIVDDVEAVRSVTARFLRRGGYRVKEAASGVEALELMSHGEPPQLILSDLTMPGMGGAELALRVQERWAGLPILFMSGYSAEELHWQGTITTPINLIQKPFTTEELMAGVVAALELGSARDLTRP